MDGRLLIPALLLTGTAAFSLVPLQQGPGQAAPQQQAVPESRPTYAPPGFEVQHLYKIPLQQQGSWVSIAIAPNGDLYASDQNSAGVYRIRVTGTIDNPDAVVSKVPVNATAFQGMVWAFNSLYGNRNSTYPAEAGIWRMRDTNNDGELDAAEQLPVGIVGGGEHGNHDVLLTEDGQGLYLINGNQSQVGQVEVSTVTRPWLEDMLTPRMPDARGSHVRGLGLPGSTAIRINPDGTGKKLISMGHRNTYAAALNAHGELFGYDADLEFDMGSPWYRPTRITHMTSGTDFGWRNGTGKLPEWTEGTMPALVDIGPGSPTGVISGMGARFPAKYQHAIYALDWTYSTIFAIHLTPQGASYTAVKEEFVFGDPFQVTDAVIGRDGHMYVLTGGRAGQGDLWRVVYKGNESTAPAAAPDNPEARQARALRRSLEAFHGRQDPSAVAAAWPQLSSSDVYLRNAARAALEAQPVASWRQRALTESNPLARSVAILALARADTSADRAAAVRSMLEMNFALMDAETKLAALRTLQVVFLRLGDPTETERQQLIAKLNPLLPDQDYRVNVELVRDLIHLRDPGVTPKAIALMLDTPARVQEFYQADRMRRSARYGLNPLAIIARPPSTDALWFAWMLRSHREGWTPALRRQYFTFINQQQLLQGGAAFQGHLADTEAEALRNTSPEHRQAVADLTGRTFAATPTNVTRPTGPARQWTLATLREAVTPRLTGRNFEVGRNLFVATGCVGCHRIQDIGSDFAPDLTSAPMRNVVATRVMEELINPDSIVEDFWKAREITLTDGRTILGVPLYTGNQVTIRPRELAQPPITVPVTQIRSVRRTNLSGHPTGLANGLNEEEVAHLVAYVVGGGNPQAPQYAPGGVVPLSGPGGGGQPAPAQQPAPRPVSP